MPLYDPPIEYTFYENSGDAASGDTTTYALNYFGRGSYASQEFFGALESSADRDWIRFGKPGNQILEITIEGTGADPLIDPVIDVVDASGTSIQTLAFFDQDEAAHKIFGFTTFGDLYLKVSSVSGDVGDYRIHYNGIAGGYHVGDDEGSNITFGSGPTLAYGLGGIDVLRENGPGDDTFFGGAGGDFIFFQEGANLAWGGSGNDTIDGGSSGGGGADTFRGGDGNDQIRGSLQDDLLFGGRGNDNMFGERDHDTLFGGAGSDTLWGGPGEDSLNGGADDDLLLGGTGADVVVGGAGDDTLKGGTGADTILGGVGEDFLTFGAAKVSVILDLEDGSENFGHANGDQISSVEIIRGTIFDDALYGNSFRNVLKGNNGNDTLFGRGGTDRLIGGHGDDHLNGGLDSDRMTGGDGSDTFIFSANDGSDLITDFTAAEDVLRFATGTIVSVSDDGVDTTVSYGADSVVLQGVVLAQGEISFEYV